MLRRDYGDFDDLVSNLTSHHPADRDDVLSVEALVSRLLNKFSMFAISLNGC
jgi:hypothetical protein